MVCNNVYREFQFFQIIVLSAKYFKHNKKLLIMYVIVEFNSFEMYENEM